MQTIIKDTWDQRPVNGKLLGVPGGTPLGEMTAALRSELPRPSQHCLHNALTAQGPGGGHSPHRAVQMVGSSGRAESGGSKVPGFRDLLWEGSFGSVGCRFYSVMTECFQTASQVFANTYDLSKDLAKPGVGGGRGAQFAGCPLDEPVESSEVSE